DHLIERGTPILRAAHTTVHKLNRRPSPRFNVAAEFLELILWLLIEGGHAGVDRSSHPQELITTGSTVQLPNVKERKCSLQHRRRAAALDDFEEIGAKK